MNTLFQKILNDIKVELLDKFDNNFTQGAFFGKKWKRRRNGSTTHLNNTGTLRRSITAKVTGNSLSFTSSTPYAAIHNEGGQIKVTAKMKKYFWAMYYKTQQDHYRQMALMKVGSTINIPKRQFIGDFPGLDKTIERAVIRNIGQEIQFSISKHK